MAILIIGLILFLGTCVWRQNLHVRIGENPYKGLVSLAALTE